jgi:hypothetical protein
MSSDLLLPGEPNGWRKLQQEALAETDSKTLDGLLRRVDELLRGHEHKLRGDNPAHRMRP